MGWSGRRESNPHRELGKLPLTAPDTLILPLGGHTDRPWLSVDDRCEPALRARRGHGRRWSPARPEGEALYGNHLPRWELPKAARQPNS